MDRSVLPSLRGTHVGATGLVDQHSYPLTHQEAGLGTVERQLALAVTGSTDGAGGPGSFLDSQLGLAVRRWCPPLLGLPPHVSAARYLARRRQLGTYAVTRMLLRGSGIRDLLVAPDTTPFAPVPVPVPRGAAVGRAPGVPHGLPRSAEAPREPRWADTASAAVEPATSVAELAGALHAGSAREVTGLEELVRQIADTSGSLRSFLRNVDDGIWGAAASSAAFVIGTWHLTAASPGVGTGTLLRDAGTLRQATSRWLAARCPGAKAPAVSLPPELLLHLVRVAGDTGRPVQLRCADPAVSLPLLRAAAGRGPLVLLPDAPKHREAARLAAVFPQVYCDVGPDPRRTLPEAPFNRLMFASRAWILPELHVVRAQQFHHSLSRLLTEWVSDGACQETEARHIAARVGAGTARRLYGLDTAAGD